MSPMKDSERSAPKTNKLQPNPLSRALFAIFGGNRRTTRASFNEEGAKKVDPKVYFANERTFLKWMSVSIWVAAISIGLSSIRTPAPGSLKSLSVLLFSAIAIFIVCYSMVQCKSIVQYGIIRYSAIQHRFFSRFWFITCCISHLRSKLVVFHTCLPRTQNQQSVTCRSLLCDYITCRRQTFSYDREAITRPLRRQIRSNFHRFTLCSFVHSPILHLFGVLSRWQIRRRISNKHRVNNFFLLLVLREVPRLEISQLLRPRFDSIRIKCVNSSSGNKKHQRMILISHQRTSAWYRIFGIIQLTDYSMV